MKLHIFARNYKVIVPGAPRTYFNDRGGRMSDRSYKFYTQKIPTSEFIYPKKSLLFLAYPKISLSAFFATQKNPGVFHRLKKITFGQNFRPKKSLVRLRH